MTPITLNTINPNESYPATSPAAPKPTASIPASGGEPGDTLQLSPDAQREVALTGRIAMNDQAGNLSADQSQQLYAQVNSIHSQIASDLQNDGGTLSPSDAQTISQLQTALSNTIYSEAHNGATPPTDPTGTQAGARENLEAGRIVLNEKAGNLSGTEAQQLGSQLAGIQQQIASDEQANGGTLSQSDAQAINQLQNQLRQQIHSTSNPS